LDEIRKAAEKVLKEFAKGRKIDKIDAEALCKSIKGRIGEVIRRRNASYAVVMPLVSVEGSERDSANWLEKELF
jgi:hypothetical protein